MDPFWIGVICTFAAMGVLFAFATCVLFAALVIYLNVDG